MKTISGVIVWLSGLALLALAVLQIWMPGVIAWSLVLKSGLTLLLLGLAFIVSLIVYHTYFRKEAYNMHKGNRAHPRQDQ